METARTAAANDSELAYKLLPKSGVVEKTDVPELVSMLRQHADELKHQLFDTPSKNDLNFYAVMKDAASVSSNLNDVQNDIHTITTQMKEDLNKQVLTSINQVVNQRRHSNEEKIKVSVLEKLVIASHCLTDLNTVSNSDTPELSVSYLAGAEAELIAVDEMCEGKGNSIPLLNQLREAHHSATDKLVGDLECQWESHMVTWHTSCIDNVTTTSLELKIQAKLCEILNAMDALSILQLKVRALGRKFYLSLLLPLLTKNDVKQIVSSSPNGKKLLISYSSKPNMEHTCSIVKTVISLCESAFQFLKGYFACESSMPMWSAKIFHLIGEVISEDFVSIFLNSCLLPAVPSTSDDMEAFTKVVNEVKLFERYLVRLDFLSEGGHQLRKFADNIDALFIDRKTENILSKARELMLQNLLSFITVSPKLNHLSKELHASEMHGHIAETALCDGLLDKTFCFPTCSISDSVDSLIDLLLQTLRESETDRLEYRQRLLFTARQIVELYFDITPTHHRKVLKEVPQVTALFHNNTMYLAHQCLTLGPKTAAHQTMNMPAFAASFVDFVPRLRALATDVFSEQMSRQRELLIQCLQPTQGLVLIAETDLYKTAERSIRQVLHQLTHLQRIWLAVLPASVYYRSIGALVGSVGAELVRCIMVQEDISAADANQLHALLGSFLDGSLSLFRGIEAEETENHTQDAPSRTDSPPLAFASGRSSQERSLMLQHVPGLTRYRELMFLLAARLQEILDRWAGGKGPIGAEFSPTELRGLIRALFQNTEKRATALSSIR